MTTIFVTGTDTGVGKTVVSKALVEYYIQKGAKVSAMKPVAAGATQTQQGLINDDAEILLRCMNTKFTYHDINPYVFEQPIAPHIAASLADVEIESSTLNSAHEKLSRGSDYVIVEGAGGWQVPLNESTSFADWVSDRQWPVVLVVGIRLGCINHASLTYLDILQKNNPLLGWVANIVEPETQYIDETVGAIANEIESPLLGKIPFIKNPQEANLSNYLSIKND